MEISSNLVEYANSHRNEIEPRDYEDIIDQAKILFNLSEPFEIFFEKAIKPMRDDYELLFNWVKATEIFYEPRLILRRTEQIGFTLEESEYQILKKEIVQYIYILILERKPLNESLNELKFLESQLNADQKKDLTILCEILLEKYEKLNDLGNIDEANNIFQEVESKTKDFVSGLPLELFIKMGEVYINKKKEIGIVKEFFDEEFLNHIKDLKNFIFYEYHYSQNRFFKIFALMRILAALDEIEIQLNEQYSIDLNERELCAFHFRKATYIIADIWGKAWIDNIYDINVFNKKIIEIFNDYLFFLKTI